MPSTTPDPSQSVDGPPVDAAPVDAAQAPPTEVLPVVSDDVPAERAAASARDVDTEPSTEGAAAESAQTSWYMDWAAISDVGRVRRDNQDSGYAGPYLLAVCDGVGGAARGDVASSTAIGILAALDHAPGTSLLDEVADTLELAHRKIGDLVDEDPALNGTSTTSTVALFDGRRIGVGHIGDSRAYLLRQGQLAQLTHDHTFVQTLIDEGRITEAEARVHPHRNLILKALDATQDPDPDLTYVDLRPGDRLLLCSDGACGYLEDDEILTLLAQGTPESAAVDLVRESLEAGSTDNVTCVVADVVAQAPIGKETLLVGAAAELPRQVSSLPTLTSIPTMRQRFRANRHEEDAPLPNLPEGSHAIANDPIDVEQARYAPQPPERYRWLRRLLLLVSVVGVLYVGIALAWTWSQHQFYVGEQNGKIAIFRGINAEVPGIELSHAYQVSDVSLDSLPDFDAATLRNGVEADSLSDAVKTLEQYAARQEVG